MLKWEYIGNVIEVEGFEECDIKKYLDVMKKRYDYVIGIDHDRKQIYVKLEMFNNIEIQSRGDLVYIDDYVVFWVAILCKMKYTICGMVDFEIHNFLSHIKDVSFYKSDKSKLTFGMEYDKTTKKVYKTFTHAHVHQTKIILMVDNHTKDIYCTGIARSFEQAAYYAFGKEYPHLIPDILGRFDITFKLTRCHIKNKVILKDLKKGDKFIISNLPNHCGQWGLFRVANYVIDGFVTYLGDKFFQVKGRFSSSGWNLFDFECEPIRGSDIEHTSWFDNPFLYPYTVISIKRVSDPEKDKEEKQGEKNK